MTLSQEFLSLYPIAVKMRLYEAADFMRRRAKALTSGNRGKYERKPTSEVPSLRPESGTTHSDTPVG